MQEPDNFEVENKDICLASVNLAVVSWSRCMLVFSYSLCFIYRCTVHGIEPSAIYLEGVLGSLHPRVAPVPVATMERAGGTNAAGNSPSGSLPAPGNYLTVSFILLIV